MTSNSLYNFVVNETWKNINYIVRNKKLTVLYRNQVSDKEIKEARKQLLRSWYSVETTLLGDKNEKVLLIDLVQKP